jgi:hypothetical protein
MRFTIAERAGLSRVNIVGRALFDREDINSMIAQVLSNEQVRSGFTAALLDVVYAALKERGQPAAMQDSYKYGTNRQAGAIYRCCRRTLQSTCIGQ